MCAFKKWQTENIIHFFFLLGEYDRDIEDKIICHSNPNN